MIEMIYNGKESDGESEVRLPKNIRQIGDNNSKKKIYVEDYVMTQLKKQPKVENNIAYGILLGEIKKVKGYTYIFVKGMVEVKEIIENSIIFNDEIWTNLYKDVKRYFETYDIVGWYVSVPYRVRDDMPGIRKLHLDNFAGNDKVCFLSDRTEKEDGFYIYGSGNMNKQSGYYIYYEKNEKMKKYLKEKDAADKENVNAKKNQENDADLIKKEDKSKESKKENVNLGSKFKIEAKENSQRNKKFENIKLGEDLENKDSKSNKSISDMHPNKMALGISAMLIIALLLSTVVMLNNYGELKNIKTSLQNINQEENAKAVNQILDSFTTTENSSNKEESSKVKESTTKSNTSTNESKTNVSTTIEDSSYNVNEESQSNSNDNNLGDEESSIQSAETTTVQQSNSTTRKSSQVFEIYGGATHTVKAGQTLYDISITYYGSSSMVEAIKEMNNIGDDYKIIEGQKIKLP